MKKNELRVLIVGQGLAGTVLAAVLESHGCEVFIVDKGHENAASMAAAGLVNPITGKRFVKSWMFDEMLAAARPFYQKLGGQLGAEIWRERELVRLFSTIKEENDWSARASLADYAPFLTERKDAGEWSPLLREGFRFGGLRRVGQVDLPAMLSLLRKKMAAEGRLFEEEFDHGQLETGGRATVFYKKERWSHIIYCDGWRGSSNPFFEKNDCWNLAKGEALTIRIPSAEGAGADFSTDLLLKKNITIAPLPSGGFWAGATTDWEFSDEKPTAAGRDWISQELEKMLAVPFEITGQVAAIRPTMFDKRPVMGFFPAPPLQSGGQAAVGVFNGMGTKGCLLAPFWAEKLARHLLFGEKLAAEVDFRRNFNRRPPGGAEI